MCFFIIEKLLYFVGQHYRWVPSKQHFMEIVKTSSRLFPNINFNPAHFAHYQWNIFMTQLTWVWATSGWQYTTSVMWNQGINKFNSEVQIKSSRLWERSQAQYFFLFNQWVPVYNILVWCRQRITCLFLCNYYFKILQNSPKTYSISNKPDLKSETHFIFDNHDSNLRF